MYTEQAAALAMAGVDLFFLETMTDMAQARAAVLALPAKAVLAAVSTPLMAASIFWKSVLKSVRRKLSLASHWCS